MSKFRQRKLLDHVRCPECGVPMLERAGHRGGFYGCSRFPLCVGTRPQGGEEPDSYTKLLRVAYNKALLVLSSPKYLGFQDAATWLRNQALGRELTEEEEEDFTLSDMANECLERGVDAAGEWCSEKSGDLIDFLLNAHEERYESLRSRLRFVTTAEQIKRMPKPEIVRRYDTSDLSQLEADLAQEWKADGVVCPRCGAWSNPLGIAHEPIFSEPMTDEEIAELFKESESSTVMRKWECGRCGEFTRTEVHEGREVTSVRFDFLSDKADPQMAPGAAFKSWRSKKRADKGE